MLGRARVRVRPRIAEQADDAIRLAGVALFFIKRVSADYLYRRAGESQFPDACRNAQPAAVKCRVRERNEVANF